MSLLFPSQIDDIEGGDRLTLRCTLGRRPTVARGLLYLCAWVLFVACFDEGEPKPPPTVVVLGSSSAAGVGASDLALGWVGRFTTSLQLECPEGAVTSLARAGLTTYGIQPDDFTEPEGRPRPNGGANITEALGHAPTLILVNLPSNDQDNQYGDAEQLDNYDRVIEAAGDVQVWITTTQPRNFASEDKRAALLRMRDVIEERYAPRTIDFWTALALGNGEIITTYDSGDGTHLNDAGHSLLASRVEEALLPLPGCP